MADRIVRRDGNIVTVDLGERRLYRETAAGHGKVYLGPGLVEIPAFVAEEWGLSLEDEEPIPGYDAMSAGEVVTRFADASDEEKARVKQYEQAHKARVTVLNAL